MQPLQAKILSLDALCARVREAQASGEAVVQCHGCFDLVHPGHVRHLHQARRLGDRLLVTISGDAVMGKGAGRPFIPQELRAENLAALDCVDWVAVSDEPTAVALLSRIRPDVYVKGREYESNRDPRFELEKQAVRAYGGRVVFTSGDVVFSSTALLRAWEESAEPTHAALRRLVEQSGFGAGDLDAMMSRWRDRRVLVIGEAIIDTYVLCDRPEVAGEAPVMTLRPLEHRTFDGGAAIVARHLAAQGARPVLLTALPRTPEAEALRLRLDVEGVEVHAVATDGGLAEKRRYLVGTQKVMKIDHRESILLDAADREALVATALRVARGCDAAIVADFGLGLLTAPTLRALCEGVRPLVRVLTGDVSGRRSNLLAFRGMDLLSPSEAEVRDALHDYEEGLTAVAWRLLYQTRSRAALVTLGDGGLIAFDHREAALADGSSESLAHKGEAGDWISRLSAQPVPALSPSAVDALGCGDALLATATLALLAGATPALAGVIGSLSAAAEAQKLGNVVIGAADLRRGAERLLGVGARSQGAAAVR